MERKQVVIVKDSHVSMALKKHSRSDPRCKAMAWDQRLGPAKMGAGQAWHCLNRSCQSPQVAQVQPPPGGGSQCRSEFSCTCFKCLWLASDLTCPYPLSLGLFFKELLHCGQTCLCDLPAEMICCRELDSSMVNNGQHSTEKPASRGYASFVWHQLGTTHSVTPRVFFASQHIRFSSVDLHLSSIFKATLSHGTECCPTPFGSREWSHGMQPAMRGNVTFVWYEYNCWRPRTKRVTNRQVFPSQKAPFHTNIGMRRLSESAKKRLRVLCPDQPLHMSRKGYIRVLCKWLLNLIACQQQTVMWYYVLLLFLALLLLLFTTTLLLMRNGRCSSAWLQPPRPNGQRAVCATSVPQGSVS